MSRGLSAAAVCIPLGAIVLGFVTEQVANLGGVRCEVSCGPGPQALPFGWMAATAFVWLLGLAVSAAGLVTSRGRSRGSWFGLALSAVLPLIVAVLATRTAAGS